MRRESSERSSRLYLGALDVRQFDPFLVLGESVTVPEVKMVTWHGQNFRMSTRTRSAGVRC